MNIATQIRKTTKIFNAYIRKRDEGKPCISCGRYVPLQAGHFYSANMYPTLRFDEDNVHGQCMQCNYFSDFKENYRKNLIERIGIDRVQQLDNKALKYKQETFKWDVNQLKKLQKIYSLKLTTIKHITPNL